MIQCQNAFHLVMVKLVLFSIHFLAGSVLHTFGLLVPTLISSFNLSLTQVSFIGGLQIALFFAAYPLYYSFIESKFNLYFLTTLSIGTLLWTIGLILPTVVSSFVGLLFSLSVCHGIGSSLCYWSSLEARKLWNLSDLYTSILLVGSSSGQIFVTLVMSRFYSTTVVAGQQLWCWAFDTYAITGFIILSLGISILNANNPLFSQLESMKKDDIQDLYNEPTEKPAKCKFVIPTIYKQKTFIFLYFSLLFANFSTYVPPVHLVSYMHDHDWSDYTRNSQLLMICGAICGKIFLGLIVHLTALYSSKNKLFQRKGFIYIFSCLFTMSAVFGWLGCVNVDGVYAFAFLFGFGSGCETTILPLILPEFTPEKNQMMNVLCLFAMVPGAVISPIIAGALRESSGSYTEAIIIAGVFQVVGVLMCAGMIVAISKLI